MALNADICPEVLRHPGGAGGLSAPMPSQSFWNISFAHQKCPFPLCSPVSLPGSWHDAVAKPHTDLGFKLQPVTVSQCFVLEKGTVGRKY